MITASTWLVLAHLLPGICRASPIYDPAVARRMLLHSDAAYCGDDLGHGSTTWTKDFSCDPCKSVDGGAVTIVGVAQGGGRDAFAYVATTDQGDTIVSFRGSVLPKNYEDDQDAVLAPWKRADHTLVHRGFVRSYESIREQVVTLVQKALAMTTQGVSSKVDSFVYVTGHSLGAAQSTIAAVDLAATFPSRKVVVYNFGDLRVGDKAFVALYNTSVAASFRVVHRYDEVPQIVPRLLYHHVPTEVWYMDDSVGNYTICNGSGEDAACQDSVPYSQLGWRDHDFYLHHAMWCCEGFLNSSATCSFPFPNGPK